MRRQYFGTDGVRGLYGGPVINESFAARLAAAAGAWTRHPGGRVLIGRDTRASGTSLATATANGVMAAGLSPVDLGILPTPAVARAVRKEQAALGVVITASHNPASDNGIKFFGPGGIKLTDSEESSIEGLIPRETPAPASFTLPALVAAEDYVEALMANWPSGSLQGWNLVVDTAHGATVNTTPAVLEKLGARVTRIGSRPDGHNINDGVGSQHPELLAAKVLEVGARVGIAHDGDGDRCILCDERGAVLDGDEILTILATEALRSGRLPHQLLVVTKQSNMGVDAAVRAAGGRVLRTDIGDRYVAQRMRAEGASLGGESSGHIICEEISPTGDGLGAALRVLQVMNQSDQPLSELKGVLQKLPHKSGTVAAPCQRAMDSCLRLSAAIETWESRLKGEGRLLVRYSGTEPKLRLLVEGPSAAVVAEAFDDLIEAARQDLGSS